MSLEEIQRKHAQQAQVAHKERSMETLRKENEERSIRSSDGFLPFEDKPPPWKNRQGKYSLEYMWNDVNWILRYSKTADRILGGTSVLVVLGLGIGYYHDPTFFS